MLLCVCAHMLVHVPLSLASPDLMLSMMYRFINKLENPGVYMMDNLSVIVSNGLSGIEKHCGL